MSVSRAVAHLRFTGASILFLLGIAAFPPMLAAQDRPAGWLDRPDKAGADMSEVTFVTMDPGWHITSGPAAIYYNPANAASGDFSVTSDIFLFDPEGRREAFGVFIGGGNLQEASQRYLYFLIRPTGEFLVKQRDGADTPTLVPWTAHDAIIPWSAKEADAATVQNVLTVEAGAETVSFHVNGSEVASLPRAELQVDGVVGLRVNHAVNLHVSSLDVKDHRGEH
jgi:hypothetical protein